MTLEKYILWVTFSMYYTFIAAWRFALFLYTFLIPQHLPPPQTHRQTIKIKRSVALCKHIKSKISHHCFCFFFFFVQQKKQYADLSSPKRRTYFKMFMRMWNKRSLPAVSRTYKTLSRDILLFLPRNNLRSIFLEGRKTSSESVYFLFFCYIANETRNHLVINCIQR